MKKTPIFLAMMFAMMIVLFLVISNDRIVSVSNGKEEAVHLNVPVSEEIKDITDEEIRSLMDEFMSMLVQDIDENYKVIHYATLDELYSAFEPIASREVVEPYIDFYYTEESDGLYIVPTETPPWFIPENSYEKEQVANHIVKITQQNLTDLYGHYTIEIEFTYENDWKITKIIHHE